MIRKESNLKLELTQSQLSIWTGQKLNPNIPLYNMAHSFEISGALNVSNFKQAFQQLVNRADILRTVFFEVESVPFQYVIDEFEYEIELVDFSTEEHPIHIQAWIEKRSQIPFILTKRLFDTVLIKRNENTFVWYLNLHHLITDASTSALLYHSMSTLYSQVSDKSLDINMSLAPFQNYITYENLQRKDPKSKLISHYWSQKLATLKAAPVFYGKNRKENNTQVTRVSLLLGKDRSDNLRKLAQRPELRSWTVHLTLFNLFTTLLFAYLYRISGQKKLAIGAPSHNRTTKKFKETPGLLMEIYPLIMELDAKETFASLFGKLKLEINEYLRHAQPGMSTAEINRSYNVILNYIHSQFSEFDGKSMKSDWINTGHCDPAHQIRCHVHDLDTSGDIQIQFDLNTDVFHKELSNRVPIHFLSLVDALLKDINQSISGVNLTTEQEKDEMLGKIDFTTEPISSVIAQFQDQVKSRPSSVAIRHKAMVYTFDELNRESNRLANFLLSQGLNEDKRIALNLYRSPEYIISVLAILKIGATFVPIASDTPINRIKYILKDSSCSLLLSEDTLLKTNGAFEIASLSFNSISKQLKKQSDVFLLGQSDATSTAYILYTSGSTGNPKGVVVSRGSLENYLNWAKNHYGTDSKSIVPFFTSIGFDLTLTSTFLPLISGGKLIVYQESENGPDMSLFDVLEDNLVNFIKLTPSHLTLLKGKKLSDCNITTMIIGGEDLKVPLASAIQNAMNPGLKIFNEYGPTEATVGCIVSQFRQSIHKDSSVPIGKVIANMKAFLLDKNRNMVPNGITGRLYLSGSSLADGYLNKPELTQKAFVENPYMPGYTMYDTGDLARINEIGEIEYLGRVDEQVKLRGYRIELSDIESNLLKHEMITDAAVVLVEKEAAIPESEVINCMECGLPSNYPKIDFDEMGICHLCVSFRGYKEKANRYFKSEEALRTLLLSKKGKNASYDCLSLLSGGKDSTYILAQLVNMGLKVLAFTLDNGYISDQAKENINKIVKKLGVDHSYGETPHMNKIFVDSLHRHKNVCNGCFKTIYTLSTQIALEKQIPFVVTGLSRGQFFETRLTEELFWDENVDVQTIDETILQARKLYHQEEDAVKKLLDVSAFENEETFKKVQFIDFYRYSDVSLEEMLRFLDQKVGWVRPTDTGRSTNCLINQVGIYVHKKQRGYSNYSFPYSWDVRLGHKTRMETLEEINELIDQNEVKRIMTEIGYQEQDTSELNQPVLVGYYSGKNKISSKELSDSLKHDLPAYMVPTYFKFMEKLPLTANGKVDKTTLKGLNTSQLKMDEPFVAPTGEIEKMLATIWSEVLRLDQVGVHDNFIALGGHSLAAIRVNARINEEIDIQLPLNKIFELPTIAQYAVFVENTLVSLLGKE